MNCKKLSQKIKYLFNGTLGKWKTDLVDFELKLGGNSKFTRHFITENERFISCI